MESNFILLLLVAICYGQPDRYLQIYPPIINSTDSRTPLTFALLMSFEGVITSGAVAGVQVALDTINNDPGFLPGYSLHYALSDSRCNRTTSIEALFKQVSRGPNDSDTPVKLAVLGAGCSVATEPTAEISHFFNLPQLSCVSSSPELANRVKFKSYFQLLPTQADIAPAFFGVIQQYGWKRVALIVQNENLFTVTAHRVKTLLNSIDVSYSEKIFESEEGIAGLGADPFDTGDRIFIIAMYSNHARPLLCEAYHHGIRYPQHLLLTLGWYADQWWAKQPENENLSCSGSDRASVLHRSMATLYYDFPEHLNRSLTTDVGINVSQYVDMEETHLTKNSPALQPLKAAPYCHDTMWTLAFALNKTIHDLKSNDTLSRLAWEAEGISNTQPFRLENFTYDNDIIMNTMFGNLQQSDFTGITGRVLFSSSGIREASMRRVFQYRTKASGTGLERVNIAIVESDLGDSENFNFEYLPNENDTIVWPDGVPYDGVPNEVVVSISVGLAAALFVLAITGIVFALACIIFNFTYREKRLIRLSSYKMNYLIGVGAILLYTDIILSVIPTTNPDIVAILCTLTPWLTAIGYSLCYGTVVVKMWRVYFIFNNPTPNRKKALKDWMLALVVGVFVLIDITVLLVYTAVEGYHGNLKASRVPNRENREDIEGELAVITRYFIYLCDSPAHNAFLGVLYGYKGVLQVMTLVLAFSTRKVKVKGLNDAKYILAAIYVSSIVLAVIIVSTYSLKDLINVFATVFSTGFFIGTTVILGLVFGPKMVALYHDPGGETVFDRSDTTYVPATTISNSDTDTLRKRVKELEAQVAKQQDIISSFSSQDGSIDRSSQPELMNGYAVGEVTVWGTVV